VTEPVAGADARPKPPKDPFGPPLDHGQMREVFRRLALRPQPEQELFVAKVNWNLLDESTEFRLMGWLIDQLRSGVPAREDFAVRVLDKLPHVRRAKHAPRFAHVLDALEPETARRLADAFGPVLGGAPKRPKGPSKPQPAKPRAAVTPPAPPREATTDDLSKLKDFFGKFGGAR
jgi:hypothetical protein